MDVPTYVPEVVESPQLVATLKAHSEEVWTMEIAADGRTLATSCHSTAEVKLWDFVAGKERLKLKAEFDNSLWPAFSPDGKTLAVQYCQPGEKSEPIVLFDATTGKERARLQTDLGSSYYKLAFAPDSKTLAVAYTRRDEKYRPVGGGIILWDTATGKERARLQEATPRAVGRMVFSPDGRTIAAEEYWMEKEKALPRSRIALWDVANGKVRVALDYGGEFTFTPDSKMVLVRGEGRIENNRVIVPSFGRWDAATGKELPALPNPPGTKVWHTPFSSRDGTMLAAGDSHGNIILWDMVKGTAALLPCGDKRTIRWLAFAPDGKTLAAAVRDNDSDGCEPGLIVLWDVATARQRAVLTGHKSEVFGVAFCPDGKLLVSSGRDSTVRLWDLTRLPAVK